MLLWSKPGPSVSVVAATFTTCSILKQLFLPTGLWTACFSDKHGCSAWVQRGTISWSIRFVQYWVKISKNQQWYNGGRSSIVYVMEKQRARQKRWVEFRIHQFSMLAMPAGQIGWKFWKKENDCWRWILQRLVWTGRTGPHITIPKSWVAGRWMLFVGNCMATCWAHHLFLLEIKSQRIPLWLLEWNDGLIQRMAGGGSNKGHHCLEMVVAQTSIRSEKVLPVSGIWNKMLSFKCFVFNCSGWLAGLAFGERHSPKAVIHQ